MCTSYRGINVVNYVCVLAIGVSMLSIMYVYKLQGYQCCLLCMCTSYRVINVVYYVCVLAIGVSILSLFFMLFFIRSGKLFRQCVFSKFIQRFMKTSIFRLTIQENDIQKYFQFTSSTFRLVTSVWNLMTKDTFSLLE